MRKEYFIKDEVIMEEYERGDVMYIGITGSVNIIVDDQLKIPLNPPFLIGELALLLNCKRNAKVEAYEFTVLEQLNRDDLEELKQK